MTNPMKVRDEAIEVICSNLIMAGVLLPDEVRHYIANLDSQDDYMLGLGLIESRRLLDMSLEMTATRNKN